MRANGRQKRISKNATMVGSAIVINAVFNQRFCSTTIVQNPLSD